MNASAPGDLLKGLEEDTSLSYFVRSERLLIIAEKYKELGEHEIEGQVRTEACAFSLLDRDNHKYFHGYFQPLAALNNGNTIPPRDFFNSQRLNYLAIRAQASPNPIYASRFADIVWDFSESINIEIRKDQMARLAIDRYLDAAEIFRRNRMGVEFGTVIKRAASLACMINDMERLKNIKNIIIRYMKEFDDRQEYRFCLDLADAIAESRHMELAKDEWREIYTILDKGAIYFQGKHPIREGSFGPVDGPNEHFVRFFLETKLRLAVRMPIENARNEKVAIAQSYEREGDNRAFAGNHIAALVFYNDAEKAYKDLRLKDDLDRLRVKLARVGQKAEGDMRQISAESIIENSKIEEYIKPLLCDDIKDSLKRIAAAPHLIPNVQKAEKVVEDLYKVYPLQFLIPKMLLKDGHIVGEFSSENELHNQALDQELMTWIKISSIFIDYLFDILKKDYGLDKAILTDHFKRWGLCKSQNIELLERGFDHYFSEDYIASLHILVPQFESVLRSLLEKAERPISRPPYGVAMIDSLLSDELFKITAGVDLIRYYKIMLIEPSGFNLRNNLAHGLLDPNDMTKLNTELIIHILLTLTRFQVT